MRFQFPWEYRKGKLYLVKIRGEKNEGWKVAEYRGHGNFYLGFGAEGRDIDEADLFDIHETKAPRPSFLERFFNWLKEGEK